MDWTGAVMRICGIAVVASGVTSAAMAATLRVAVSLITANAGNPYTDIAQPIALPANALFDTLTTVDAQGHVQPGLAVSWTLESPTTWIVKLRPGIAFANGEPLTAEALAVSAAHMNTVEGRTETWAARCSRWRVLRPWMR